MDRHAGSLPRCLPLLTRHGVVSGESDVHGGGRVTLLRKDLDRRSEWPALLSPCSLCPGSLNGESDDTQPENCERVSPASQEVASAAICLDSAVRNIHQPGGSIAGANSPVHTPNCLQLLIYAIRFLSRPLMAWVAAEAAIGTEPITTAHIFV